LKAALDANLPPALASALHALAARDGHTVAHVDDLAGRGAADVDIFKAYAEQQIEVHVSQDHHNRRAIELEAIASAGLIVFVLAPSWASMEYWPKAANLVRWWPSMMEHAARSKPPAMFRVPWKFGANGRFELIRNLPRKRAKISV